ncbi:hypothetical protein [Streptomyces sp. NPDC001657]|uniref:hypothetical protein n=1 Tax=Streptomyces sp. NPDC001657 TaxID=3154522 RepID=UPI0033283729
MEPAVPNCFGRGVGRFQQPAMTFAPLSRTLRLAAHWPWSPEITGALERFMLPPNLG